MPALMDLPKEVVIDLLVGKLRNADRRHSLLQLVASEVIARLEFTASKEVDAQHQYCPICNAHREDGHDKTCMVLSLHERCQQT